MTRLVLTLLVIATAVVAGILFYPKQRQEAPPATQQPNWHDQGIGPKTSPPSSLIDF